MNYIETFCADQRFFILLWSIAREARYCYLHDSSISRHIVPIHRKLNQNAQHSKRCFIIPSYAFRDRKLTRDHLRFGSLDLPRQLIVTYSRFGYDTFPNRSFRLSLNSSSYHHLHQDDVICDLLTFGLIVILL